MKVLVTAATKYGATGEIARAIGDLLTQRGFDTTVVPPEEVSTIEGYDAVVLGSAVYAGHWLNQAKELVDRSGLALATRPVWLFSSGPIGDPPKPEEDPVDVKDIVEITKARDHRVFAGKLIKKQLSFPEKAIALALRVPEGDFRDWTEIRDWGTGIAEALLSGRHHLWWVNSASQAPGFAGPVERPGACPRSMVSALCGLGVGLRRMDGPWGVVGRRVDRIEL